MRLRIVTTMGAGGALLLSACATPQGLSGISAPRAGFDTVAATTRTATGKESVWLQSAAETEANARRVKALTHGKTIGVETAVQVALLNNRGLQAAYADLGLSAADVWQQTMLVNPTVSLGIRGIGADGLGGYRSIEATIASNIVAIATRDRRLKTADIRFRQAQLLAASETLRVAAETRRAWIEAVAAFEAAALVRDSRDTADAASELAARLGDTGFLNKADQSREHAVYAEMTGQQAQARLAAELAKEALTRQLGLWGSEVDYFVPDALPQPPAKVQSRPRIEEAALKRRVDLAMARLELEAIAQAQGLTEATRYLTDLEVIAGAERERELHEGAVEGETTPQVEVEFEIPVFDSGKARLRKAELAYMRAANELAEQAVNVRSEARAAYHAYTASHRIAQHYRDAVVPLRQAIEEESLLSYSGMITSTFELLADIRARLNSSLAEAAARRDFWLADADLMAALYGGGGSAAPGQGAISVAGVASAGH
ncbi:TolC family protein [Defluviimonas salinarum]|uniref:TolC family protein n=1 Tax=Defluviimonas salinarum TaxID=2992147 RepID=A0ABT3J5Y0_9RHOB|nr:TolC family protein [Defluviimonas salinarum]MCW3782860.1 TolC family protein [Defluviimonas salinarum]